MKINKFDLKGKVIIVTGGYGHLGNAITQSLLFHGAKVIVLGKSKEKFDNTFVKNNKILNDLDFIKCDVSDSVEIKEALETVYNNNKKIDVLINNAFYIKGSSPPDKMSDEDWSYGIDGTLNSIYRCIREIIPFFKIQKSGKIINVSSMYGLVSPDFSVYENFPEGLNPPHYGAAKAGVIQLSKYFANFLGKDGVTVNTITPGAFPSENVQRNTDFIEVLRKKTALERIGKPEELAGAFVFLSSDASSYITGQNIIVDGGWTSR